MKREKTEKLPPLTRRSSIKRNPLSGAQLSRTDSECCGQLEGIAATGLSAYGEELKEDGSFDGPSLFLMSRPDLEAAFVAQHQDHARRKAAFDKLSDNFTQERAKVLALEKKIEVRSSIFYGIWNQFQKTLTSHLNQALNAEVDRHRARGEDQERNICALQQARQDQEQAQIKLLQTQLEEILDRKAAAEHTLTSAQRDAAEREDYLRRDLTRLEKETDMATLRANDEAAALKAAELSLAAAEDRVRVLQAQVEELRRVARQQEHETAKERDKERQALVQAAARSAMLVTGRRHRARHARRVRVARSRLPAAAALKRAPRGARARRAKARRPRAPPRQTAHASRVWRARHGPAPTMALRARR